MITLFLFSLYSLFSFIAAETIELSWKNCTTNNALGTIDNVTFTPNTPNVGDNFTIYGIGETYIDVNYDGLYDLTVSSEGFPLGSIDGNLCNASYLDLEGDYGRIYYPGMPCPILKGDVSTKEIGWINPDGPWFSRLVATATFNGYYKNKSTSLFCVEIDITFT